MATQINTQDKITKAIKRLTKGLTVVGATSSQIATATGLHASTVRRRLAVMREAKVLVVREIGRKFLYALAPETSLPTPIALSSRTKKIKTSLPAPTLENMILVEIETGSEVGVHEIGANLRLPRTAIQDSLLSLVHSGRVERKRGQRRWIYALAG